MVPRQSSHLRGLALAAVLLLTAACEPAGWSSFSARHSTYRFAAGDVVTKEIANRSFIRVAPPDEAFELVFDSRIDGQMDARGYRKLFSVSDYPLAGTSYRRTDAGVVVCRTGVAAIECALPLASGGDQWSMLFPAGRKGEVVAMAARARDYLGAHNSDRQAGKRRAARHFRCADNSWLLLHPPAEGSVRVERPDLARSFAWHGAPGRYTSAGFTLQLEGMQAQWTAPHRLPLPCFDTGPQRG